MGTRTFAGFGFGAIQAGLFLYEAFRSGNFGRLVVAEVVPEVVAAVRRAGGCVHLNLATANGIEHRAVTGVEIYNPREAGDQRQLIEALSEASEIATALPSVRFYGTGAAGDAVDLLARAFARRHAGNDGQAVVYAAENHNHAAEILWASLSPRIGPREKVQCLNTVIGKMCGVVTDAAQIREQGLHPLVDGFERAILVEEFNRILISRITLPGFVRGIGVFEEKPDLLPFEEAKLYGHNATHALLGYLLQRRGARFMADAAEQPELLALARAAFLEESGAALRAKHAGRDELFTEVGYRRYVDELMTRMLNPHLRDSVERVTRDPKRKLGWDDRLVGTMRLALSQGIEPRRYALGAAAAARAMAAGGRGIGEVLDEAWLEADASSAARAAMKERICKAGVTL